MKRTLLLTSVLLALTAPVALAGGVNLAWGTVCWTEGNQNNLTTFACDTNGSAGDRTITVSWKVDTPIPDLLGVQWIIAGQSGQQIVPDYWALGAAPACRAGMARFESDYMTSETADQLCIDWTMDNGFNAGNYMPSGWGRFDLTLGTSLSYYPPFAAEAGQEYYGGGVTFINSQAVGTGACVGCVHPMAFELVLFEAVGSGSSVSLRPHSFTSNCNYILFWQAGVVPARGTTWGQIKSLYR